MKRDTVVVTGGGRGIGLATAKAFLEEEYNVAILDIMFSKRLEGALCIEADITNEQSVMEAFDIIKKKFGCVHVLINNAATACFEKSIEVMKVEEFKKVISTNLISAYCCVKYFTATNIGAEYGRIVNISSTRFAQNQMNMDAYGASKGGIVALTNSLCISLAEKNITVNCISPGWIECGDYSKISKHEHSFHPSNRVGVPEDIARACLFLSKRENDFINGANLFIDGGVSKKMIYPE